MIAQLNEGGGGGRRRRGNRYAKATRELGSCRNWPPDDCKNTKFRGLGGRGRGGGESEPGYSMTNDLETGESLLLGGGRVVVGGHERK